VNDLDSPPERKTEREEAASTSPHSIEVRLSTIGMVAGVSLAALAIGIGAFAYGRSTGEDLQAARASGMEAGQRKGTAKGAAEGYAAGFKKGREAGFRRTYSKAYRESYAEAFEEAGLDAPAAKDIPVSLP
jgi:flagellar biosynthesis/type III secretory pathway protein FliH